MDYLPSNFNYLKNYMMILPTIFCKKYTSETKRNIQETDRSLYLHILNAINFMLSNLYFCSCDVTANLSVKIGSLEGHINKSSYEQVFISLFNININISLIALQ